MAGPYGMSDGQLEGQLSIYDWMPESDPIEEILWNCSSAAVRGYLSSGSSAEFIKSFYKNMTAYKSEAEGILIRYASSGVHVSANGMARTISWEEYLFMMQAMKKKNDGWKKRW